MNALFIGPYRQQDGWGLATREYIKAISTQIPNIASRPLYYIDRPEPISSQLLSYENTQYDHYDIVFQKCLPHNFSINKSIKQNIGLTELETNYISKSICIDNINGLNKICVPSEQSAKSLKQSGVKIPINVISQPIDIDLYTKYQDHTIPINNSIKKTFKFYTIGEFIERKNLLDLITAFHLAFDLTDDVSLIIKTNIPGMSTNDANKYLQEQSVKIKKALKIRSQYKAEFFILDRLSEIDMIGLHNTCDCFVMPSYGEAFCRPAAEALISGKTPIVTNHTGMTDFVNNDNGYVIKSHKHPVIMASPGLSAEYDIYTANEHWYKPDILHLIECMKNVYHLYKKNRKQYEAKKQLGIASANQFSYTTIGKKICG